VLGKKRAGSRKRKRKEGVHLSGKKGGGDLREGIRNWRKTETFVLACPRKGTKGKKDKKRGGRMISRGVLRIVEGTSGV